MNSKVSGAYYEQQALYYLQQQKIKIISRNFSCRFGEIDLICQDQNNIVFVEVRYRKKSEHGSALESVTTHKQAKIKKAATYFLLKNQILQHCFTRFDVIAIDQNTINWVKAAF